MQPKVLIALDFRAPAPWAVVYAVQLAARLKFPLVFLGVAPGRSAGADRGGPVPENIATARLAALVRLCQEEGVGLEILLATGPFCREICRLVDSAENFRFLVMGAPKDGAAREIEEFSAALKDLRRCFRGEILLVREQGKVADLADWAQPD